MNTTTILTVVVIILYHETVSAQLSTDKTAHNAIYIEALGMGGYGSVNYERLILRKENVHIGVRLGVGTYRLRDFETRVNPDVTIPFSLNAYYGKIHHVEVAIGQTFASIVKASAVDFKAERDNSLNSNLSIGYRYQKSSKGVVFRLNYCPIISSTTTLKHWYGLSIGYAFF